MSYWPGYHRAIAYAPTLARAQAMCINGNTLGPWCPRKGGYAIVRPRSKRRGKAPRKLTPEQEQKVLWVLAEQDRITREARGLEIEYGIQLKEYRYQLKKRRIAIANRRINATRDVRLRLSRQSEGSPG
jgi:hypothetical protein